MKQPLIVRAVDVGYGHVKFTEGRATGSGAPPSTKNRDKARDPEMHQTKKGKDWHFGMEVHIGADSKTGLVHSASVTAANVYDSHEVPNLLHVQETRSYGDSAYRGKAQRERLRELAPETNASLEITFW